MATISNIQKFVEKNYKSAIGKLEVVEITNGVFGDVVIFKANDVLSFDFRYLVRKLLNTYTEIYTIKISYWFFTRDSIAKWVNKKRLF